MFVEQKGNQNIVTGFVLLIMTMTCRANIINHNLNIEDMFPTQRSKEKSLDSILKIDIQQTEPISRFFFSVDVVSMLQIVDFILSDAKCVHGYIWIRTLIYPDIHSLKLYRCTVHAVGCLIKYTFTILLV